MNRFLNLAFLVVFLAFITSCENKSNEGKLTIQFEHWVNGQTMVKDQMIYINAAGNHYELHGLKYFISDVKLHLLNGQVIPLNSNNPAHYVDIDIPGTLKWQIVNELPAISYDSVSFTFGLSGQLNKSNSFVNPPESNMAWPEALGGGYHFMMMDGFFNNSAGVRSPFNFHLGTGQIYSGGMGTANITGFIQNSFHVKLPASSFIIINNQTKNLKFIMNIESWFTTPIDWDFNQWSIMIMQNQLAMDAIKKNGFDVFSFATE
jgi:hypothetical protein